MNNVKTALIRAAELLALWFTITAIGPGVAQNFPEVPPLVVEIIVPVLSAVVIEFVIVSVLTPASIRLSWKRPRNPVPPSPVDFSAAQLRRGAVLELSVSGSTGSPLGWVIFRRLVRSDLQVTIDLPAAPFYLTADISTPAPGGRKPVIENPDSDGLLIHLRDMPPSKDGAWVWSRIVINANAYPSNERFDFKYRARASSRFATRCARVFLRIRPSARQLVAY